VWRERRPTPDGEGKGEMGLLVWFRPEGGSGLNKGFSISDIYYGFKINSKLNEF
jgi:hypothetical protein